LIIILIKIKITHLLIVHNASSQKTNYQHGTQGLTMPNVFNSQIYKYIHNAEISGRGRTVSSLNIN